MNKIEKTKREERHWQNTYGGSLQINSYNRAGTRMALEKQFERVANALQIGPHMRLLDLGCGAGHLLHWLSSQYEAEYHGVDMAFHTIQHAQKQNLQLQLAVGDAEALPYPNAFFDRVSCFGAGHHSLDFSSTLGEIYRVLVPGGLFIMYEPVSTFIANVVRKFFLTSSQYESPADLENKHAFTTAKIQRTLHQAGFIHISSAFYDFLAYPLTGMYIDLPFGRSKRLIQYLATIEKKMENWAVLKPVFNLFSWRLLVTAAKPR